MKTNHILLTAALLLSAASCTKEATEIPGTSDDNTLYPVTFSCGIDLTQTKATSTYLTKDAKVTVYVYKKNDDVTSATTLKSQEYTVGDDGTLTLGENTIYLAKGDYDFYAVSEDKSNSFSGFSAGVTSNVLSNGVNYLHVKKQQTIKGTAEAQNVELEFVRKAVSIIINIVGGDGIEIDSWATDAPAKMTLPDPGSTCKMALSDGTITSATSLSTSLIADMTTAIDKTSGVKASVSCIMLPLVDNGSPVPKVTLKIKVKNTGESTAIERTYETNLKYPTGGFVGGNQYTYTATLKANGITFTGATVAAWGTGTLEDGNLTPTEPDNN